MVNEAVKGLLFLMPDGLCRIHYFIIPFVGWFTATGYNKKPTEQSIITDCWQCHCGCVVNGNCYLFWQIMQWKSFKTQNKQTNRKKFLTHPTHPKTYSPSLGADLVCYMKRIILAECLFACGALYSANTHTRTQIHTHTCAHWVATNNRICLVLRMTGTRGRIMCMASEAQPKPISVYRASATYSWPAWPGWLIMYELWLPVQQPQSHLTVGPISSSIKPNISDVHSHVLGLHTPPSHMYLEVGLG